MSKAEIKILPSFCGEEHSAASTPLLSQTIEQIEELLEKTGLRGIVFLADDKTDEDGVHTTFLQFKVGMDIVVPFAVSCIEEDWFRAAVKVAVAARAEYMGGNDDN